MPTDVSLPPSSAPSPRAASLTAWIDQLQKAVEAASAEARGALFYYTGFGLYFAIAVAGTSHEDLLRGATVAMPGLGVGMPLVGFYLFVPLLFVVFHVYTLLQLVILARRVGWLKLALKRRQGAAARRQSLVVSPFAISQRLFGEPPGLVPRTVLAIAIWLTLVLIPLALLLATQLRFLPYHAAEVTWAHRLYLVLDALLLLLLWPLIIHPGRRSALAWLGTVARRAGRRGLPARVGLAAAALARRRARWRRSRDGGGLWRASARTLGALSRAGLVLLVLFVAFVVATIPGEAIERRLLAEDGQVERAACASPWQVGSWLDTVRLPDRRTVLCVTYGLFEAPETPLGLRRNMVVREARLVAAEPSQQQIDELGFEEAWRSKGDGVDLQNRDLRYADLSGSDLRRADLRGANLEGAVLHGAKLVASRAGDIARAEVGACMYQPDAATNHCLTGLVDADLTAADLRSLEGWKSDFQGADLSGASLQDAELGHARLDGALLVWARLDRAKLDGASLTGAVLREASAPEVRLNDADLAFAFLRQANLAKANLIDIELERADLGRVKVDGAIYRRQQSYSAYLRRAEGPGAGPAPPDGYAAPRAAADAEVELTASLFERACRQASALSARGVVQRLWHEFDYSRSHDEAGYAEVAELRYLLARLILSGRFCPGAAEMDERHRGRLRAFLVQWCDWRSARVTRDDKPVEPDLARRWSDLRARVIGAAQAAGPDGNAGTGIWSTLRSDLGADGTCSELARPPA